jgi:signal transduction histidine kinase
MVSSPPEPRARSTRWFIAVFSVTIAGFVGGTFFMDQRSHESADLAFDIASNAIPSIVALVNVRFELRRIETTAERLVRAAEQHHDVDASSLEVLGRTVDAAIERYAPLVTYPGERARFDRMVAARRRLDHVVLDMARLLSTGETSAARTQAGDALLAVDDELDTVTRELIELNADQAQQRLAAMDTVRSRDARLAYVLDASVTALAIFAIVLAVLSARREGRLRQWHEQYLRERSEEMERFSARVAHDIRGPLTTIGLAVDSLARGESTSTKDAASLERAKRGIERARTIIDGLLSFARAGARGDVGAQCRADEVAVEVVNVLRPSADVVGVELRLEPPPQCSVGCNEGVLSSVIANLVGNAIKYIGSQPVRCVTVRVVAREAFVRVEVEDTGPGVAPELVPRLFEPFVRGPDVGQPGAGLGLATVKILADRHGGAVGYSSARDGGAIFWVELPRATGALASAALADTEPLRGA